MASRDKEASQFVETFMSEFHGRFGIFPRVSFSFQSPKYLMSLKELEEVVNELIKNDPIIRLPGCTVRSKNRQRELVIYRQCTFKIACEMEYGPSNIGMYFGKDHATVIYSRDTIYNLVGTGDKKVITTLSKIENELQKRIGTNGDVQPDDKGGINA